MKRIALHPMVIIRKEATLKPSQFIPFGKVDDAYDKLHAENEELKHNLEFAYKRAKVLADMLNIPIHESPEVTGTILGLVRGSVERLQGHVKKLQEENAYVNDMLENAHNRSRLL